MKKNQLYIGLGLLAIGGLFLYMKRKNSNDSTFETFNADGEIRGTSNVDYKWNGQGITLRTGGSLNRFRKIIVSKETPFKLTGIVANIMPNPSGDGTYVKTQNTNADLYYESNLVRSTPAAGMKKVWFPEKSIRQV